MKKLVSVAALVMIIVSCKPKEHGGFVVSGNVENAPGKKLLLMETPYGASQPVILDSTMLKDKGAFTLRGRANEESIFRLVIENGPDVVLINDNDNLTVHLDVNDYRNYSVQGSPASESLHKLFEDYRKKDSSILASFKNVDSVRSLTGQDSTAQFLQTANDLQITALNNMLKEYITNATSPSATLYALGLVSQTISEDELKSMVDAAVTKFPDHPGLAKVKSMLAVKAAAPAANANSTYALLNQQAPDLTMEDVNGKQISISNFKGKYVLVDFWASWCGPCRQENPNVVAAYNEFKNKNFTILGVSLDEDKGAWKNAIAKDNLTWTHMSDLKQWQSAAVQAYGIEGIPFNVLLDPTGKIIASSLRGEDLFHTLATVLK